MGGGSFVPIERFGGGYEVVLMWNHYRGYENENGRDHGRDHGRGHDYESGRGHVSDCDHGDDD